MAEGSGVVQTAVQYSKSGNRTKISFPALVFNRTPNRQRCQTTATPTRSQTPIMSSKRNSVELLHSPQLRMSKRFEIEDFRQGNKENRDSNNLADSGLRCLNHQNKKIAFEVTDTEGQKMYYCEKCAILLASQGFQVQRIHNHIYDNPLKNQTLRNHQIQNILKLTDETSEVLKLKYAQCQHFIEKSEQTLELELQKLHEYYDYVHSVVENHRQRAHNQMIQDYRQAKTVASELNAIIQDSSIETENIRQDINQNRHKIIHVTKDKYEPIVEFYKLKLKNYKNSMKQWSNQEIVPHKREYRSAEELQEMVGAILGTKDKQLDQSYMTSSKKLRGRNASIYFSFEADKGFSVDTIPQENMASEDDPSGQY